MSTAYLYGECRQLGFCGCDGRNGCDDSYRRPSGEIYDNRGNLAAPAVPKYKPYLRRIKTDLSKQPASGIGSAPVLERKINAGMRRPRRTIIMDDEPFDDLKDDEQEQPKFSGVPDSAGSGDPNCGYCRKRGTACVRHGGERSGVYTAKKHKERQEAAEQPEPTTEPPKVVKKANTLAGRKRITIAILGDAINIEVEELA